MGSKNGISNGPNGKHLKPGPTLTGSSSSLDSLSDLMKICCVYVAGKH